MELEQERLELELVKEEKRLMKDKEYLEFQQRHETEEIDKFVFVFFLGFYKQPCLVGKMSSSSTFMILARLI